MEYSELAKNESMHYSVSCTDTAENVKLCKIRLTFQVSTDSRSHQKQSLKKSLWMDGGEWQILLTGQWVRRFKLQSFPHLLSISKPGICHSMLSKSLYLSECSYTQLRCVIFSSLET